eukprot:5222606-Prymnesium_polylepis.1
MEPVFGADEFTYGGRPFKSITSTGVVEPGIEPAPQLDPWGSDIYRTSLPPKYEASPAPPAPPEASPAPPI